MNTLLTFLPSYTHTHRVPRRLKKMTIGSTRYSTPEMRW